MNENEKFIVQEAMMKYGGGFASKLGEALARADAPNTAKIKNTWSELWDWYKEMGETDEALMRD